MTATRRVRTGPHEPWRQAQGLFRSFLSSVSLCLCGLSLCCLCAIPSSARAQDVTVEQLVTIALERSPELRVARAEIAVAAGQVTQARPSTESCRRGQPGAGKRHDDYDRRSRVAARSVPAIRAYGDVRSVRAR